MQAVRIVEMMSKEMITICAMLSNWRRLSLWLMKRILLDTLISHWVKRQSPAPGTKGQGSALDLSKKTALKSFGYQAVVPIQDLSLRMFGHLTG